MASTVAPAGSSLDQAAKGSTLRDVEAAVAGSFERNHRNNLIDSGVLPT